MDDKTIKSVQQNNTASIDQQRAKLKKTSQDFEAVFVSYLLKTMKGDDQDKELFGESYGGDVMDGLFEQQFGRYVSEKSSIGLADKLLSSLERKMHLEPDSLKKIDIQTSSNIKTVIPRKKFTAQQMRTMMDMLENKIPSSTSDQQSSARIVNSPDESQPMESRKSLAVPVTTSQSQTNPSPDQSDATHSIDQLPSDEIKGRIAAYHSIIENVSKMNNIEPNLVRAVIATESAGKADSLSPKNAKGLMQLRDSTAAELGVGNVWNPADNIDGGTRYLRQLLDRFDGDMSKALASYNAGPAAVERHNGIPPYKETQAYVRKVLEYKKVFDNSDKVK